MTGSLQSMSKEERQRRYRKQLAIHRLYKSPRAHLAAARTKLFLEGYPLVYNRLVRFLRRNHPMVSQFVGPQTQVVIDGFPRSANGFVSRAFLEANGFTTQLAHHSHSPTQIILGCRRGLPTLVLIREPRAALVSFCAYQAGLGAFPEGIDERQLVRLYLDRYVQFHRRIEGYRARFEVADFEEVTRDVGAVFVRFGKRFGRDFARFEHTEAAQRRIFRGSTEVLSPNAQRDAVKGRFEAHVDALRETKGFARAQALYNALSPIQNER